MHKMAKSLKERMSIHLFQMATFVADNVASAMYLDGLIHTHPISVPVKDPAEIESVFDAISYQKVEETRFFFVS